MDRHALTLDERERLALGKAVIKLLNDHAPHCLLVSLPLNNIPARLGVIFHVEITACVDVEWSKTHWKPLFLVSKFLSPFHLF